MSSTVKDQLIEQFEALPENLQRQVLAYVRALQVLAPHGVPGEHLLQFGGTIPLDDLKRMQQVIEDGCEQVDLSEW